MSLIVFVRRQSCQSFASVALILILVQLISRNDNIQIVSAQACNQDILDRSFVTQCGRNLCEPLIETNTNDQLEWPTNQNEVVLISSSRQGDRFKISKHKAIDTDEFYYEESHVNGTIFANPDIKYQRILGFGTTISDAACKNVDDLPNETRTQLIRDYFDTEAGLGINLIRVPIGSTKFSYTNYVLDQPDSKLVELSPYDTDHRIPIIKDALKSAGKFQNRIKVLASSATAPPEMKMNNKMIHGGGIKRDKLNDYANYLLSFISAYKTQDINIWSLILNESPASNSGGNETRDDLEFNSMSMQPVDSIGLIRAIEQIRKQQESIKFRLLIMGDSRLYMPVWADAIFEHVAVSKSAAGIAYTTDANDSYQPYDNLVYVTRRFPNKYLVTTQGAVNSPIKLGNWQYAENYVTDIVKNLEYGSVGWIDFNMALDLKGGPCVSERFKSDAAIIVDAKRAVYYRNPMFYAIGHLSRYVKPGSIRVKSNFLSSAHMFSQQHISFVTPDNYLIVFVANNNIGPMPVRVGIDKITKVELLLDTKSFNTFIFRL